MTDDQVQQVITALQNESLLDNWQAYGIIFAVSLIGAWFGAWIKSYSSEKGKYKAIEKSLDTITKQVSATTETSEKIKVALDHNNWRKKELEILKRQKLEDYYFLVLSLVKDLENETQNAFYDEGVLLDQSTFHQAKLIQALYLPEILEEHNSLFEAVRKFKSWVYEGAQNRANNIKLGMSDSPDNSHIEKQQDLLNSLRQPIGNMLVKLQQVASELNQ